MDSLNQPSNMRSEKLRLSDSFLNTKFTNYEQLRLNPTTIANDNNSVGRNHINMSVTEKMGQISFGNDRAMSLNPSSRRY